MRVRLKNIRLRLKRVGFYIPFTWYFVLFFIAAAAGRQWLKKQTAIPDSAYSDVFSLLLLFAEWFCFLVLSFGLLSVLISYLFFRWKQKREQVDFNISSSGRNKKNHKQYIAIRIHPILKPFLGFIKIRFSYDKAHFSEKFHLVKQLQRKIINTTLEGVYQWSLPEIKEYRVEKTIIYFEDLFQFFSFALTLQTGKNFYTQPIAESVPGLRAFPRKTEDTNTRIDQLRKVEGEHINYKNFESNDDVRRIVWKIYAKNKELVVRIPEILDPYASHVYLYASFFSFTEVGHNEVIEVPFLNYYKTIIWSVYRQLGERGLEVRYIPDQEVPQNKMENAEAQVNYTISVSKWQIDRELNKYIRPGDAAVVIVSSLSDPEQVRQLLEKYGSEISFLFIPLTESLKRQHIGDWLQWLFVQQQEDSIDVYRKKWSLSITRFKILQNERQLKELFAQYQKSTVLQKKINRGRK